MGNLNEKIDTYYKYLRKTFIKKNNIRNKYVPEI